jgi:hypothetical protein
MRVPLTGWAVKSHAVTGNTREVSHELDQFSADDSQCGGQGVVRISGRITMPHISGHVGDAIL